MGRQARTVTQGQKVWQVVPARKALKVKRDLLDRLGKF